MQTPEPGEHRARDEPKTVPPDPVGHNIATVAELRAQAEQEVDRHQRTAEKIAAGLGRTRFLYLLLFLMSDWVVVNLLARPLGFTPFDPPPFNLLISIVNVAALLISSVVLISQNRQGKLAERREHLDLQINMLTDQRTAKIIALLEELRQDMPSVKNRVDLEAQALSETINPKDVLDALESSLELALEGAATPDAAAEDVEATVGEIMHDVVTQEQQKVETVIRQQQNAAKEPDI